MERSELEDLVSHLTRTVEELSDEVARQGKALDVAERRIAMLMERLAEAELSEGGSVPLADQRPPPCSLARMDCR